MSRNMIFTPEAWAVKIWTRPENAGRQMDAEFCQSIADAIRERDATWSCERQSDTWQGCYEEMFLVGDMTDEFTDITPCRSCQARKWLGAEVMVE